MADNMYQLTDKKRVSCLDLVVWIVQHRGVVGSCCSFVFPAGFNSTQLESIRAIRFAHNSCSTHLLDKEVYQLADYHWVCGDGFASAFSSHFHLQRVDDTEKDLLIGLLLANAVVQLGFSERLFCSNMNTHMSPALQSQHQP
ncbi:hypothetical protein ACTXT7_013525 [Hymenolepis weldensis]